MSKGSFKGMSAYEGSTYGESGKVLAGRGAIRRDLDLPGELKAVFEVVLPPLRLPGEAVL
jgi:hypothetical protein